MNWRGCLNREEPGRIEEFARALFMWVQREGIGVPATERYHSVGLV